MAEGVARVRVTQSEISQLVQLTDGQVDGKDSVVVCDCDVIGAICRPSVVDRSVANWLLRVVNQPRLDCRVLTTIESGDVVQLEVSGTDY